MLALFRSYNGGHLQELLLPLLIVTLTLLCIVTKFNRHLYAIPGPFLASFTSLWKLWDVFKGTSHETSLALHAKYGALVRIGPNHVSVGDPAEIKTIYAAGNGFKKTGFYPIMAARYQRKPLMNLFATRDEEYHSRIKRPVAHTYSMASLSQLEPKVDQVSNLFIKVLKERYAYTGMELDLGEWLQWYAFDVIGNLTFSRLLGFLEGARDVDNMIASISGFMAYASTIGQVPFLHYFLAGNPLLPMLYPDIEKFNPAVMFAVKCMEDAETQELETKEEKGYDDFLTRFRKLTSAGAKGGLYGGAFGPADIVNHTSSNILAGSDTTAIALRSAFHGLCTNPIAYTRLQKEIDSMDRAGKLSDPITEAEARQMPYLQAVIKEALRIHPSVGMMMERHVPKGGTIICGKFFPEGTVVGINPWVVARDKDVYGRDAGSFRPERWLDATEEQLKAMERTSLAFGAGSRVCIGKNISLMEMSKLIPQILRDFDVVLVGPKLDLKVYNYWFPVQKGLACRLYNRSR